MCNVLTMHRKYAIISVKGADFMATTNVTIRMDTELKKQAEEILSELGMNMSTAYTVFMKQLVRDRCFPFVPDAKAPNEETREALEEVKAMEKDHGIGKGYTDVSEMFEDILK